jgi:haloalkane dehalogenase
MQRRELLKLGTVALLAAVRLDMARAATPHPATEPTKDAAAFIASRRFAPTSFGRIAYVSRGRGEAALFLHGFPLNGFQWRGAIARLSAHRRCIAPDFLGLGYTEPAAGQSVTPAAQVEMLGALLDQLNVGSVDLIASDSGGLTAQLFAVRHPSRVRTLLLTNCDTEIDSPPPALAEPLKLAHAGTFGSVFLRGQYEDKALARSGLGNACYTSEANLTDEMVEVYLGPLTRDSRRCALADAFCLGLEKNPLEGIEAKLKTLTQPARLVWGTADEIFSMSDAEYLSGVLRGSRGIRRVEGGKLFFAEEFPDVIAEEAKRLWGV